MKKPLNFAQINGADQFFRSILFPDSIYSEGCNMVANEMEAYWLIDDIILFCNRQKEVQNQDFLVWKLQKLENNPSANAVLIAEDGNNNVLWRYLIPLTDFDFDRIPGETALHKQGESICFFYENNTLILPEER